MTVHDYSSGSNERRNWTAALFSLSFVVSLVANGILIEILKIQWPWWFVVETPTTLGLFFGVIHWAFGKYIWRYQLLHKLRWVTIPDLNGKWKGHVCSSYDDHQVKKSVTMTIKQTWNKIRVELISDNSISCSEIAAITRESSTDYFLHYCYKNEPKPSSRGTMHAHRGTAHLRIKDNKLEGRYYSGRDRCTFGELLLTRN